MPTLRALLTCVLIAGSIGCSEADERVPALVEISPAGALLTPSDPSQRLTARVYDAAGEVIETPVTWESSAPGSVQVDDEGTVTALAPLGSAVVTAQAGDVRVEILVVAASPVEGTVLIDDDAVLGQPELGDDAAPFGVGSRYDVTLSGVAPPDIGTLLLGRGEKPVAGRVVEVRDSVVTLEMVPIDEIVASLDIGATLDLSRAPYVTPDAVAAAFEMAPLPDGSVRMTMGPTAVTMVDPAARASSNSGPFECESELTGVQIQLAQSSLTFTPALFYEVEWNATRRKIVVGGDPQVTLEVAPKLSAAIDGSVTCKLVFREIHVPVPGFLGLLIGAVVPLGAGFEIGGQVPIGEVGAEFTSTVGASLRMGFDCDPDCVPVQSLTPIIEGSVEPLWPSAMEGIEIEAESFAFLFADLEGGARFSSTLRVEAIEAKAGLKVEAAIASEQTQADDPDFKGSYGASFLATIGAGSDFSRFLGLVHVNVAELELAFEAELARSPEGTAKADRDAFAVGDTVTFDVSLDPGTVDFFGVGYDVTAVRIYRRTSDSLVLVNEVTATAGQTDFVLPWVATVAGTVGNDFVAFLQTKISSEPRIELDDVTSSKSEGASLTFQEHQLTQYDWTDGSRTETYTDERTCGGSLLLEPVTDGALRLGGGGKGGGTVRAFEVVGGTVSCDEKYDYVQFSPDVVLAPCTFDETLEDHSTGHGSAPATGDLELYLFDDSYSFWWGETEVPILTQGVWTARYEYHSPETDCRTDVTDEYEDSDDRWVEFDAEGTVDSADATVFAGTTTESGGDTTITRTWSLVVQ